MNACQRKTMGGMKQCNRGGYNWWWKIDG